MKSLASNAGVVSVNQKGEVVSVHLAGSTYMKSEMVLKLTNSFGKLITFNSSAPYFILKVSGQKMSEVIKMLIDILKLMNTI
jgi:hypothetical protein